MHGTPLYLSPQVIRQIPYDYRVDIWAIGCVAYQLSSLTPPYSEKSLKALLHSILYKEVKPIQVHSQKLYSLISALLEKRQRKRPFILQTAEKLFPGEFDIEEAEGETVELYKKNKGQIEKLITDLNLNRIDQEYEALKSRVKKRNQEIDFKAIAKTFRKQEESGLLRAIRAKRPNDEDSPSRQSKFAPVATNRHNQPQQIGGRRLTTAGINDSARITPMRGETTDIGKSIGILSQRPVKLRHKAQESIGDLRRIEEARHSKESLKLPKIEPRGFQPPIPEEIPLTQAIIREYPDRKDSGSTVLQKESGTQLHIAKLPNNRYVKPHAPSLPDSALSPMTASISQPKLQKMKYNPLRDTPLLAREQTQDIPQKINWAIQRDIVGSRASTLRRAKLTRSPNDPAKISINGENPISVNAPLHTSSPKTINKYKSRSPATQTPKRGQIFGKEAILYSNGALRKELTRAGRFGALGGLSDVNEASALFTDAQNIGAVRRQSQNLVNYTPKAQSHFVFGGGGAGVPGGESGTPTHNGGLNSHRSISLSRAPRRDTYQKWAVRAFVMRSKKTISDLN